MLIDQFSKTFDPRSAQVAVFSHLIHFAVFDHITPTPPTPRILQETLEARIDYALA
jgi:hypothetical protein